MFINSIFLPKTISDQTVPESSLGKIGNFSHLFLNVFRFVNDEQESTLPFQDASLNPESAQNTPNELLKVSLLSDTQSPLENTNISLIVTAFLSKLNSGENDGELTDNNKVNMNEKVPKYFSLSKIEFINEIKSIIKALISNDAKSLESVQISLIANGQSIKINPFAENIIELENWANEQLQSNSDFEILVKSGLQKLSLDVEPLKMESLKTFKPLELISINPDDNNYTDKKSIVDKNTTEQTPSLKNITGLRSASKQPLDGMKQTITPAGDQIVKQDISIVQKQGNPSLMVDSKIIFKKNIVNDQSVIIEPKVQDKVITQNIHTFKSDLTKEFTPGTKNELVHNAKISHEKVNVLNDSKSSSQKNIITEKQVDAIIKSISNESKIKSGVLPTDEPLKNIEILKKASEVNVKEINNSELKITIKSNQKINSISTNKSTSNENIVLNDLIKKTDVKDVDIKIQKIIKTNSTIAPKIQNENHPDVNSSKNIEHKNQVPILNREVKKGISSVQETKQPSVNKTSTDESFKAVKTFSSIIKENENIAKPESNTKSGGTVKLQTSLKIKGQQELFVENKPDKYNLGKETKIESTKGTSNNQQTDKTNSVNERVGKSIVENKKLEQIKASYDDGMLKPKTELIDKEISKKNLTPEIKIEQKPFVFKSDLVNTKDESVNVQYNKSVKEVIKENVKESNNGIVAVKSNTGVINNENEKTELNSSNNPKIVSKNIIEQSVVENLKIKAKPEVVTNTQFENKSVKIDLMQRRVYSQIPPLEVIAEETEIKNLKNAALDNDVNKNIKTMDETIKSTSLQTESKTNNEKQVWVKVSFEKHNVENVSEIKKQAPQQSKITIDTNNDGLKKDSDQNNYSEKESVETKNFKTQNVSVDNNTAKEQKPILQNQSTNNQPEIVSNIKPEIKSEHNPFKSELQSDASRFNSRAAEIVEKIKVISSGELVREIYKVFESGEKQSIVLRLVPKELGSIKIMLDTVENVLTAKVEVENESVGSIIRNNVDQLKQSLSQSGVNVNSINISYHNPDQKQNGFQNHKRKSPSYQPGNDLEEVDESILSKKMGYNTYEYLA